MNSWIDTHDLSFRLNSDASYIWSNQKGQKLPANSFNIHLIPSFLKILIYCQFQQKTKSHCPFFWQKEVLHFVKMIEKRVVVLEYTRFC